METDPRLSIELIWEDVHLVELCITASNGEYSGRAKVYFAHGDIAALAEALRGFPKTASQVETFAGGTDRMARAKLVFRCLDQLGHTAVRISLADFAFQYEQPPIMNEVELELRFDPSALDVFWRELEAVVKRTRNRAVLRGISE